MFFLWQEVKKEAVRLDNFAKSEISLQSPGEVLEREIAKINYDYPYLYWQTELGHDDIDKIITGVWPITPALAEKLEKAFPYFPAGAWMRLQQNWEGK